MTLAKIIFKSKFFRYSSGFINVVKGTQKPYLAVCFCLSVPLIRLLAPYNPNKAGRVAFGQLAVSIVDVAGSVS